MGERMVGRAVPSAPRLPTNFQILPEGYVYGQGERPKLLLESIAGAGISTPHPAFGHLPVEGRRGNARASSNAEVLESFAMVFERFSQSGVALRSPPHSKISLMPTSGPVSPWAWFVWTNYRTLAVCTFCVVGFGC
jgi:hypothetical protein